MLKRKSTLKINRISKQCGWCDDARSNYYNQYIKSNSALFLNIKYEKLWREDEAYDILIVISHNTKPTIKNKGSAIFIHCSFNDYKNTAGCIAIKKNDLIFLLKNLEDNTYVRIRK